MRAKEALRKGELVPLADLIRGRPEAFLLNHDGQRQATSRCYLTAWAVAHYLTFDRRLLGSALMDQFVLRLSKGEDATAAFSTLVGQPLPAPMVNYDRQDGSFRSPGTRG